MSKFNQQDYQNKWNKENIKRISVGYKTSFVEEFKSACEILGITQSQVIRAAMEETIEKAKNSKTF